MAFVQNRFHIQSNMYFTEPLTQNFIQNCQRVYRLVPSSEPLCLMNITHGGHEWCVCVRVCLILALLLIFWFFCLARAYGTKVLQDDCLWSLLESNGCQYIKCQDIYIVYFLPFCLSFHLLHCILFLYLIFFSFLLLLLFVAFAHVSSILRWLLFHFILFAFLVFVVVVVLLSFWCCVHNVNRKSKNYQNSFFIFKSPTLCKYAWWKLIWWPQSIQSYTTRPVWFLPCCWYWCYSHCFQICYELYAIEIKTLWLADALLWYIFVVVRTL